MALSKAGLRCLNPNAVHIGQLTDERRGRAPRDFSRIEYRSRDRGPGAKTGATRGYRRTRSARPSGRPQVASRRIDEFHGLLLGHFDLSTRRALPGERRLTSKQLDQDLVDRRRHRPGLLPPGVGHRGKDRVRTSSLRHRPAERFGGMTTHPESPTPGEHDEAVRALKKSGFAHRPEGAADTPDALLHTNPWRQRASFVLADARKQRDWLSREE